MFELIKRGRRKALRLAQIAVLCGGSLTGADRMNLKTVPAPVIRTSAEPIRQISIIPMFSGQEEYLADLIRERHRYTSISEFALMCSLHPQGDDPLKSRNGRQKRFAN